MKKLLYLVLVLLTTKASAQYVTNGPEGGQGFGFYLDGGRTWLAANTGVYFSDDNGLKWNTATPVSSAIICDSLRSIAAFGNELYAGAQRTGIYRSLDGAQSWSIVSSALPKGVPYTDVEIIGPAVLAIRGDSGVLYRSTDQGGSWVQMNFAINNASANWLSVFNNGLYVSTDQGLFHSMDNGSSYTNINPSAADIGKLVWVNDTAYVGTASGIKRSLDGGMSFSTIGLSGEATHDVAAYGNNIFAVTGAGSNDTLKYSTNGGSSFSNAVFPTAAPFYQIHDLIISGSNLLLGTDYGLYRTPGSTVSFSRGDSGFYATVVRAMAVNGLRLYAASSPMGVFYTPDSGMNWIHNGDRAHGVEGNTLAIDAKNQYVHAGGASNYYRSSNFGQTWTAGATGMPAGTVHSILASKTSPNVYAIRNGDLYHSSDDGGTFTAVSSGVPAGTAYFVTQADTALFISAAGGLYKGSSSGLAFTATSGISGRVTSVVYRGTDYYASTSGTGLYTSSDGMVWKSVIITAPGVLPANVNALVVNGSALIAGTNDGLYTDSTGIWMQDSLQGKTIWSLAVMDGKVYAGTCAGVWSRENLPATPVTGIASLSGASQIFQVYPNPAHGSFRLAMASTEAGEAEISMFDMLGHAVSRHTAELKEGRNEFSLSAAQLPAGVYMVQLKSGRQSATQRIVLR